MTEIQRLKEFVLTQSSLIDKPGKLLYSAGTTVRLFPIYFLGTKPGGILPTTIRQSLSDLDDGQNEYLDYRWEDRPPGQHKLQKQIQRFVTGLGFSLRDVPGTNIIFTRDRSIESHPDMDGDAILSWPIHLFMMRIIRPQTIVAYGSGEEKSPFAYLRRFLSPPVIETIHSGQGKFFCHRFTARIEDRPTRIVAVPHLTRYSPYTRPEIMNWIKEYLPNKAAALP